MKEKNNSSRRKFIKQSAVAAAGISIIPRHVMGRGFIAPSDKLNIAVVGGGGKGHSDAMNSWNKGAANITNICDVDWNMSKNLMAKFPTARKFRDWRKMFDSVKDFDAVTVSTPDHNHAVVAMAAMKMGKHVYVQKPLTNTVHEARMLTEATAKYKVVTQMGNQGASGAGVHKMVEWFDQGKIGKVHHVDVWTDRPVWVTGVPVPTDKPTMPEGMNWDGWVGPSQMVDYHPLYHPFKWRGWWDFGTGALGDMGCHLMDPPYRVLGLNYPTEVESSVGAVYKRDWSPEYTPEACPSSSHTQLKFPASAKNPTEVTLTWTDGGLRPFRPDLIPADHNIGDHNGNNGVIMYGEKGIMTCGVYGVNPKIYMNSGELIEFDSEKHNTLPENGHQIHWVEACKAGFGSAAHKGLTSSFDYAGPFTETVLMGNVAIRSFSMRKKDAKGNHSYPGRRKLLWDGPNMRMTNYEEANQFVKKNYRAGWSL